MIDRREPYFRVLVVQHILSAFIQNVCIVLIDDPLQAGADVNRANLRRNLPKGVWRRLRSRDA
jgi:hypothetical protein